MTTPQNQLLEMLPTAERSRLLKSCKLVDLVQGESLFTVGDDTRYVYFPTDGFISLITFVDGQPTLEVGMVGREGMVGVHVALGVARQPLHALVQGSGPTYRIGVSAFKRELTTASRLREIVHRYVYVLMAQFASSAGCLRFHQITPRLARWLLMMQDRAHSDEFRVTHEFLAYMLGVRRVGITNAAGDLKTNRLITYGRGEVTVLDRKGLEAAACTCYRNDRRLYNDSMRPSAQRN